MAYTNASLINLLHLTLDDLCKQHNIPFPELKRPDPASRGVVPDSAKKMLLRHIVAIGGLGALLGIGRYIPKMEDTPVVASLLQSRNADTLAEKWMRLEHYQHSSHRTEIRHQAGTWHCRRVSTEAPASREENSVIAGLLLGLVASLGYSNCELEINNTRYPLSQPNPVILPRELSLRQFTIHWQAAPAIRQVQTMLATIQAGEDRLSDKLATLIASDIARPWRLADVAADLGISTRSLQRHLAWEQRTFSGSLRRARMREASRLLLETTTTIADIGYCCGYADQAHFQRDFLRASNLTPNEYRRLSQAAQQKVNDSL